MTHALNAVVLGEATDTSTNEFRQEVAHALSGKYGEWRFLSAAALLENAVFALDFETLEKVYVVPSANPSDHALLFEGALSEFMAREHEYKSVVSVMALECASSLILEYMRKIRSNHHLTPAGESLLLMQVLESTKHFFFGGLLQSQTALEAKDALVRAVEAAVMGRYTASMENTEFAYALVQHSSAGHSIGADCLSLIHISEPTRPLYISYAVF